MQVRARLALPRWKRTLRAGIDLGLAQIKKAYPAGQTWLDLCLTVADCSIYKPVSHDNHGSRVHVCGLNIGVVEGGVGRNEVEGGTVLKLFLLASVLVYVLFAYHVIKNMKVKIKGGVWTRTM